MKWYRPIPCDKTVDNPLVCELNNFELFNNFGLGRDAFSEYYFFQGKEITDWPEGVCLTTNKEDNDGIPDDVLQNKDMIPVFSQRLVDAIKEENIEGIQFLPVAVYDFHKKKIEGFYIANCTIMFDAFDYEKSRYWRFPDDFINENARGKINCSRYVLREELLKGYDVFRLEGQCRAYFVSERFVKMFRKHKFTGYSFKQVELS